MNYSKEIRLFKNSFLEKLTHVHPIMPLLLWGPVILWLFWRSIYEYSLAFPIVLLLGLFGFFVWTLAEYLCHRFIFHFKPHGVFQERVAYLIHGIHHDDPDDATRLVMPPVAAMLLAFVFYLIFRILLGPIFVEPFFAAFLIGYLCYDYIHFSIHHFKPRTAIGRYLKQNHMYHHFVSEDSCLGVSSPLWDFMFGTKSITVLRKPHEGDFF